MPSLAELRDSTEPLARGGRISVTQAPADVRALHRDAANAGALFQVASQFNLLEMVSQDVTPEQGVTRYQYDATQGPACAIAAGAATIYRNYFVPIGNRIGQTRDCQLDGLADLAVGFSRALDLPVASLWEMRNGYALCSRSGLEAITSHLRTCTPEQADMLRGLLRIGVHRDVEVTDAEGDQRPRVSQAFCSALPVACSPVPATVWKSFASIVLEAAYEATLWAAVDNAQRGGSNTVLLTWLGGGAFGNDDRWIHAAVARALGLALDCDLDVKLVSRGRPSQAMVQLASEFA